MCQVAAVSEDSVDSYTLLQTLWSDDIVEELPYNRHSAFTEAKKQRLRNLSSKVLLHLSSFKHR